MGSSTQTLPLGAETSIFLVLRVTEGTAGLLSEVPGVDRREEDKLSFFSVVACQTRDVLSSCRTEQKILLQNRHWDAMDW